MKKLGHLKVGAGASKRQKSWRAMRWAESAPPPPHPIDDTAYILLMHI